MTDKVDCLNCANTWCCHNSASKLSNCKDYYPRTFIEERKVGDRSIYRVGWYDDRKQSCYIKIEDND